MAAAVWVGVGCAGPRAKREFVQQADRLHQSVLAPANTPDPELADYVQTVGDRLLEGARAAAPVLAAVYAAAVGYRALLITLAAIAFLATLLAYGAERREADASFSEAVRL